MQRWEKLKDPAQLVLKVEAEIRRSSRTEAVKPMQMYLDKIVEVLNSIIDDTSHAIDAQSDTNLRVADIIRFCEKLPTPIDLVQK